MTYAIQLYRDDLHISQQNYPHVQPVSGRRGTSRLIFHLSSRSLLHIPAFPESTESMICYFAFPEI